MLASIDTDIHYYSGRLKERLSRLLSAPTSLVEAPCGYGKTSAVRDLLADTAPQADIHWFTAVQEAPEAARKRLSHELSGLNQAAAECLAAGDAALSAASLHCSKTTYLVLDNCHLLRDAVAPEFFEALLERGPSHLHCILISRPTAVLSPRPAVPRICAEDFCFREEDIDAYFQMAGLTLPSQQLREIQATTGGWPAALSLQARWIVKTGKTTPALEAVTLMRSLAWESSPADCQDFLLAISPFTSVSVWQACFLSGVDVLPGPVRSMLQDPLLFRFNHEIQRYDLHPLLSIMLQRELGRQEPRLRASILVRAGQCLQQEQRIYEAFRCFWLARDYESALSLELCDLGLRTYDGTPVREVLLDIADHCPEEIRVRHPLGLLRVAYALFGEGLRERFSLLMEEIYRIIEASDRPAKECKRLLGEWTLVSSLLAFPRIAEMDETYRCASLLLDGPSHVITPREPYLFGCISPWHLFHREAGRGEEAAALLECAAARYTALTGGCGAGVDILYRGELACMQGDYTAAEILAHKALRVAEAKGEITICYGAALLWGRVAASCSNIEGLNDALNTLDRLAQGDRSQSSVVVSYLHDIAHSMLWSMLEEPEQCADWIREGRLGEGALPWLHLMLEHVRITDMMVRKEYLRAIGIMEAFLLEDEHSCGLVAKFYIYLGLSISHLALGDTDCALQSFTQALEITAPDRLFSTFTRFMRLFSPFFQHPKLSGKHKELTLLRMQRTNFFRDGQALCPLAAENPPEALSEREHEVALLASQGLRNIDIAQRLFISQNTVKKHMKSIFEKLSIQRRSQISERLGHARHMP